MEAKSLAYCALKSAFVYRLTESGNFHLVYEGLIGRRYLILVEYNNNMTFIEGSMANGIG